MVPMLAYFISFIWILCQLTVGNAIVCPNSSFVPLGTYCVIYMGNLTYNLAQAKSMCAALNSSLPTFLDLTEQTALSVYGRNVTSGAIRLGYYNGGVSNGPSNPGIWYDLSGTTCLYIKWGPGEPNGYGGATCTCFNIYSGTYAVNDGSCTAPMSILIEAIPSNCIITTPPISTSTTTETTTTSTATTTITDTTTTKATPTTSTTLLAAITTSTTAGMSLSSEAAIVTDTSTMTAATGTKTDTSNGNLDLLGLVIAILSGSVVIFGLSCITGAAIWMQKRRYNAKICNKQTQT